MVSRYDIATKKWLIGFYIRNEFIVMSRFPNIG
jgi:hypothetical protein